MLPYAAISRTSSHLGTATNDGPNRASWVVRSRHLDDTEVAIKAVIRVGSHGADTVSSPLLGHQNGGALITIMKCRCSIQERDVVAGNTGVFGCSQQSDQALQHL